MLMFCKKKQRPNKSEYNRGHKRWEKPTAYVKSDKKGRWGDRETWEEEEEEDVLVPGL